ncbi:putative cytoplasm protein [Papiliotrema laurentii]|uniref:Cytoplasm protein n=1 Tax=Papiliotrema laurentii TaxID=5418 RepID=A0AAD9L5Y8_PAPLA|nr:putative cytoplasm protein [Papiliotrema laurentii]
MVHAAPHDIVVIGGGIAGVSTAYFLARSTARQGAKITLVEGVKIAAGASGYSGGFLAKDWHGSATADLSAMSYDLHAKLAEEFGGADKWGYRVVDTLSVDFDATKKSKRASPLKWLPEGLIQSSRSLGTPKTTAQVHPRLLTSFLSEQFLASENTDLVIGHATLASTENGAVSSVTVSTQSGEKTFPADAVVIAAGPWTGDLAVKLLGPRVGGRLGVTGHRAHSIVLKTRQELSAHCLFTSMTLEDGSAAQPEVYTRPDGTTYICGSGDDEPLPPTAADVKSDPKKIANLKVQAEALSPVFTSQAGVSLEAEQACYLPIADRGRPLIGKVKGVEGVYIGSGMSCWGVTQGPGTGLCLAELILEGKVKSADISKLAP